MLTNADFHLSDEQLRAIDAYFRAQLEGYLAAGEAPATDVTVEFTFSAPLGRCVVALYDGGGEGLEVEFGGEPLPSQTRRGEAIAAPTARTDGQRSRRRRRRR